MHIEFDLKKALSNVQKHGVTFEEAASTLLDENALVIEDSDSESENRWVLTGMSDRARLITVVYTFRQPDKIRLISARTATRKEAKYYA